jgi:hypothetical protein
MKDLQKGDKITADWLRELVREVRRNRVVPGQGLRLEAATPEGKVIALAPQRHPPAASIASSYQPPQWQFGLVVVDEVTSLRVGFGVVHWGGQHWTVWPHDNRDQFSGYKLLDLSDLADGDMRFVVWVTESTPVPLYHCPLQPGGPRINFRVTGGDCLLAGYPVPGDPTSFDPDPGDVVLVAADSERSTDWTDCVLLGSITKTGEHLSFVQLRDDTIFVNAIKTEAYTGDDPNEDPAPPCGHPGNEPGAGGETPEGDDTDHPGDSYVPGSDSPPGHPGDTAGDNGNTPTCGDGL